MNAALLTVMEMARELKVSPQTVRRLVAARSIPAFRVGRQVRFDVVAVREALFVQPLAATKDRHT